MQGMEEFQFRSSTPLHSRSQLSSNKSQSNPYSQQASSSRRSSHTTNPEAQISELQKSISKLALENEELQYELRQVKAENEQLYHIIQEKEDIQAKMGHQLETVSQTAYTLYNKFRAFKCRYYEEKFGGSQN